MTTYSAVRQTAAREGLSHVALGAALGRTLRRLYPTPPVIISLFRHSCIAIPVLMWAHSSWCPSVTLCLSKRSDNPEVEFKQLFALERKISLVY
jgi:hypothetical protein